MVWLTLQKYGLKWEFYLPQRWEFYLPLPWENCLPLPWEFNLPFPGFAQYEQDIRGTLSGRHLAQDGIGQQYRYPFFRIRANQIRQAAEQLYGECASIREFLNDACDVQEARRRLVSEVAGLGPKQASLFLRNTGYATHVAILDVHVLCYMNWVGLTNTLVKSVSSVRKYESLEDAFIEHSCSFGYTPDRFDLAVWVVVKVAKEEYKTWG